jgi:hypothetical protein
MWLRSSFIETPVIVHLACQGIHFIPAKGGQKKHLNR